MIKNVDNDKYFIYSDDGSRLLAVCFELEIAERVDAALNESTYTERAIHSKLQGEMI